MKKKYITHVFYFHFNISLYSAIYILNDLREKGFEKGKGELKEYTSLRVLCQSLKIFYILGLYKSKNFSLKKWCVFNAVNDLLFK